MSLRARILPAALFQGFNRVLDAARGKLIALANRRPNEQARERILPEGARRERDERLRQAVRVADIGIFDHDQVAETIYWSPEQRKIYGVGPNEVVTLQVFLDHVFPGDRERIGAAVARAHDPASDGLFDVEHRIVRSDGSIRWIDTRSQTFFEGEGPARRAVRTVGAVADITERKSAEAALRQSEQRFRALVELSSDWYWQTDEEHRFAVRQGEVLRRMGVEPEADLGKKRWEMEFLNMSDADWEAHRAALDRREEFRDLLLGRRVPDGRVAWATVSGRPLFDDAGKFIGYHGTGRDVTAQVNAERALRESEAALRRLNEALESKVAVRTAELAAANKELEAFAYSVSHDLRAPLRAIDGFSRVLIEDHGAQLDAEARGHLERVRRAVQRLGLLIDELLELSRVGRTGIHMAAVDLSRLAAEVAEQLRTGEPARAVQVAIAPGVAGRGDEQLLRLLLQNLLGNAWKYTRYKQSARIEFGGAIQGGETVYYVRDNGAGFDMAYADKLFKPFQRLHRVEEFEGTGVGLAIVARVIQRHAGRVWAEGRPGAGATFYFTLAAPPAAAGSAPRAARSAGV
jgi:PAS domain S-box-containing protein